MKVFVTLGTRPEVIKLFPVFKELNKYSDIEVRVCNTGQHMEMVDQFLSVFKIKPDYNLEVMEQNQTPSQVASAIFSGIEEILIKERPDYVIIEGDTTTVAAVAMAAFYNRIKVAHVEAGLRTYDKWQPFPEEINRKIVGTIADLHFAPTERAKENLMQEGIAEEQIFITGNPVIDSLKYIVDNNLDHLNYDLELDERRMILVTAHRRENFGKPLCQICDAIKALSMKYNDRINIIYPVHLNPNVWKPVHERLDNIKNIKLIPPIDYFSLVNLMKRSYFILTDSGGIQEEAPSLGKPVLVLREKTERPEAVKAGVAKLVGTEFDRIITEAQRLIEDEDEYKRMARAINPYGDGKAAQRIAKILHSQGRDQGAHDPRY